MDNQPTILIVDDEPFNVDLLEQELEELGYNTLAARNGREALSILAQEMPDLVLLDIMMPEMDGFSVLRLLKNDGDSRNIPVIVISAMDDMSSVVRGIELGAEDYLPKPFDPVLLQARIKSSLEKKAWRDKERMYLNLIEAEKRRADELLHVILPAPIVAELKENNSVRPRLFDGVAVLFADIVGFTPYADRHTPDEVVAHLQELVAAYEQLVLDLGLQKIKTIGDAFMAAGGLFEPLDNPTLECVRCGLEMIALAARLPAGWQVRVGIHSGPVAAGIIGQRQYLYDLWGDTVNTAQRIESNGKPGYVNLSATSWARVSDYCAGESIGPVKIKGKGAMEIFTVFSLNEREPI